MHLKICFVGLGSIGMRHCRNLSRILKERGIAYTIHALRESNRCLPEDIQSQISRQARKIDELDPEYDIALVANPTMLHYQALQMLADRTKHFFVEKPLFESTTYDLSPFVNREGVSYVAAPLRHSAVFEKIQELIAGKKIFSARAICSSYLPAWRKDCDYRKVYSARKDMGGGVRLDLIHEWDYLCALFGMPEEVCQVSGQYSHLEIDSEDIAIYIARYADKLVELHLDYFGRVSQRNVQIFTENELYTADFIKNQVGVQTENSEQIIELAPADMYVKEMNCFLDLCLGIRKENPNSIEHAYEALKIVLGD